MNEEDSVFRNFFLVSNLKRKKIEKLKKNVCKYLIM